MSAKRGAMILDIFSRAPAIGAAVLRDDHAEAERIRGEVHDLVDAYLDALTVDIGETLRTVGR